jgi:DNA-binding NarL/FixJ family response regulator
MTDDHPFAHVHQGERRATLAPDSSSADSTILQEAWGASSPAQVHTTTRSEGAPIGVVLIGDQPLWQDALAEILRGRLGRVSIASVASVKGAIDLIEETRPELVILDLAADDGFGEPAIEAIVRAAGSAPVIALDARLNAAQARRTIAAGAKGYVIKTSTGELIAAAVSLVLAGGVYFPHVARESGGRERHRDQDSWRAGLSQRQSEVLGFVMLGKTNQEIAERLGIALPTVKLHVRSILRAAGVRSRTEVVVAGLGATPVGEALSPRAT